MRNKLKGGNKIMSLYQSVLLSQHGDKEETMKIINQFKPLIKCYSHKLNYEDAEADLTVALIEIIKSIPVRKDKYISQEAYLVSYIHKSVLHRYYYLYKKKSVKAIMETCFQIEIETEDNYSNVENLLWIDQLLDMMPKQQRVVINGIFIENKKQTDIAKELHISRQAINKIKNQALKTLRKKLDDLK